MSNLILAEFKGTYRAPHPEGFKEQNVLRDFRVKVKMPRKFLDAPGLNGLFSMYYKDKLKALYPDYIDTYLYDLVQATELDGNVIDDPKALSYEGLKAYITKHRLKINVLLYSSTELRDQVLLYKYDEKGQQFLQGKLQENRGAQMETAAELAEVDDLMVAVDSDAVEKVPVASGTPRRKGASSLIE